MSDKNSSEKHKYPFTMACATIGLGVGFLLYTLGYKSDIMGACLFLGAGMGLLIDTIMRIKR